MQNMTLQLATKPAKVVTYPASTNRAMGGKHLTRYRKELIKVGQYVKDSVGLAFEVTADTLRHWKETFDRWIKNGNKVPIPLGHSAADDPGKNQGWVRGMFVEGDSLVGILELANPELALTTDVSIFVPVDHTDGTGEKYDQPIAHVALCTCPVIPGLEGFQQLSLSLGDVTMSLKEKLAKALDVAADSDEDAIMKAFEAVKAKGNNQDVELAHTTPTKASAPLVKLVCENRSGKVAQLVSAGLLTPAAKTAIEEQYMKPEAVSLSLSGGWDDGFDFLVKIIAENQPVPLVVRTGVQLLELANVRAQGEANPVKADIDRRIEAAKK